MTKAEFERAMNCGLGRCIAEVEACSDKSRYQQIVLNGCMRTLAYDSQSEGTRAEYLFRLIKAFKNDSCFLPPLLEKLKTADVKEDWYFAQLTELVALFAKENDAALCALREKYTKLYAALLCYDGESYNFERDAFERVAIVLVEQEGWERYKAVTSDIGKLFLENSYYDEMDFEWFCLCFEEHFTALKNAVQSGNCVPEMAAFYHTYAQISFIRGTWRTVKRKRKKPLSDELRAMLYSSGKKNEAHFMRALNAVRVSYRNSRWHELCLDMLHSFEGGEIPKEALSFIYNKSLCSCCRLEAVKLMQEQGMLTKEIKEECRSDSSVELRGLFAKERTNGTFGNHDEGIY